MQRLLRDNDRELRGDKLMDNDIKTGTVSDDLNYLHSRLNEVTIHIRKIMKNEELDMSNFLRLGKASLKIRKAMMEIEAVAILQDIATALDKDKKE